jgi:hypothetical protein
MYKRFDFEGDIHDSLSYVPLSVRRKLDLSGLKISLTGWQALSREERLSLCHLPVDSVEDLAVYREVLQGFAARANVTLEPLWGPSCEPGHWNAAGVQARLSEKLGARPGVDEGRLTRLSEEERYALFKLAEPKRQPDKLLLALKELGLDE